MLWFTRLTKPAWVVVDDEAAVGECERRVVRPFVSTYLSRSICEMSIYIM